MIINSVYAFSYITRIITCGVKRTLIAKLIFMKRKKEYSFYMTQYKIYAIENNTSKYMHFQIYYEEKDISAGDS